MSKLNYKTIVLSGTETKMDISGQNCDIRNDGTDTVYAGSEAGVTAGADGVASIPAGQAAKLFDTGGTVYLLGTGSVLLCGNDYAQSVFKAAATSSGGGGEDTVARNAINTHAGNTQIHLTAAELEAAIEGANAYSDDGDAATLAAAKEYADALSMGGSGVSQTYVDTQDSVTLDTAKQYASDLVQPVSAAVDILNGTGEGSVAKTVSDQISELVAGAPDDLNTIKEISDWITNHPDDAAAMNSAITQNAADIATNAQAIADINDADNGILAQAKTYSDSVGAAAMAHSDSKDAETLEAAKAYADVQDTAALNSAKDYVDSKLITGSEAASLDNCPEGCWYGQYE